MNYRGIRNIVYRATCTLNGKMYIGYTTQTFLERKGDHLSYANTGQGFHFHNAIRKYGAENFEWDILYRSKIKIDVSKLSKDDVTKQEVYKELKEKEMELIEQYDSFKNGYNSTIGGDGTVGGDGSKGEDNGFAILTDEKVLQIIDLLIENELTTYEIAEKFNCDPSTISMINAGKTWTHLYDTPPNVNRITKYPNRSGEKHALSKLTTESVIEIKKMLAEGFDDTEISKFFDVSKSNIGMIKHRKTWARVGTEYHQAIDEAIEKKKKEEAERLEKKRLKKLNARKPLTKEQVKEIKRLLYQGMKQIDIAKLYGKTSVCISDIDVGKTWADITIDTSNLVKDSLRSPRKIMPNQKLTEEKVRDIKLLIKEGKFTDVEIANYFEINAHNIWKIKIGEIWKNVNIDDINDFSFIRKYDKLIKKRKRKTFEEQKKAKKLSIDEIKEIKVLLKEGNLSDVKISKMFNVSPATIKRIKQGKTYSNIKIS